MSIRCAVNCLSWVAALIFANPVESALITLNTNAQYQTIRGWTGVAGAMAANKSGLQTATLRNLLLAWVLTLPVCVFLGAMFFAGSLLLVTRVFGIH